MDYPTGFPEDLKPPIDEALATAELLFFEAKSKLNFWRAYDAEPLIFAFVKLVFFAFAHQMCRSAEERREGWNLERVRRELDRWFHRLLIFTWQDKHPIPEYVDREFMEGSWKKTKNSEEWRELQTKLKKVAEVLQRSPTAAPTASRPDQDKARRSLEPKPDLLANLDITLSRLKAAEALGVSPRTLDRWVRDKLVTPVGAGLRKRFRPKELKRLLDQRTLDKRDKN
jgi:Helix-turn-helix domain